ncbi:MAG: ribonuclease HII [Myxococcales bacterium]
MGRYDHLSLSELRRRFVTGGQALPRELEERLRDDPRAGAAAILAAVERRRRLNRAEGQRLRHLCRYERELWDEGFAHVAGVDEAGMSPLAGPVVAGAAMLPRGFRCVGIDDSKKLGPEQREQLAATIRREAVAWGVGRVEPEEIDRINIYRAGLLAMRRAVQAMGVTPDYLLIDARTLRELDIPQRGIIKGDANSISIAAASILAKTARDALMVELDRRFPGYGLAKHKGYPVAEHVRALERLGVSPIHRRSFGPVKRLLGEIAEQQELF